MIVINGSGVNRAVLKQRFAEGGYQAREAVYSRQTRSGGAVVHPTAGGCRENVVRGLRGRSALSRALSLKV